MFLCRRKLARGTLFLLGKHLMVVDLSHSRQVAEPRLLFSLFCSSTGRLLDGLGLRQAVPHGRFNDYTVFFPRVVKD